MCLLELTASTTKPWKVELTIGGTDFRVPLQGHHILHSVRPPSLRSLLTGGSDPGPNSTSDITIVNTYHLLDEAQTEVDVADTISGEHRFLLIGFMQSTAKCGLDRSFYR